MVYHSGAWKLEIVDREEGALMLASDVCQVFKIGVHGNIETQICGS